MLYTLARTKLEGWGAKMLNSRGEEWVQRSGLEKGSTVVKINLVYL